MGTANTCTCHLPAQHCMHACRAWRGSSNQRPSPTKEGKWLCAHPCIFCAIIINAVFLRPTLLLPAHPRTHLPLPCPSPVPGKLKFNLSKCANVWRTIKALPASFMLCLLCSPQPGRAQPSPAGVQLCSPAAHQQPHMPREPSTDRLAKPPVFHPAYHFNMMPAPLCLPHIQGPAYIPTVAAAARTAAAPSGQASAPTASLG